MDIQADSLQSAAVSMNPFAKHLIRWYRRNRRDLPWRVPLDAPSGHRPDPYYVLVSEAMLQQTQVATVIPYFNRFIQQYPTLQALAGASEQNLLRLWQGLGYYSRARNLLRAAQLLVHQGEGRIPRQVAELMKLPGVGRYTAGAIASLAYNVPAPIVDGNVIRVLSRVFAVRQDPRSPKIQQKLWQLAEGLLPPRHAGEFNSSLMELGATVCTPRSPSCLLCPVRSHCQAYAKGIQDRIPAPRNAKALPVVERVIYCLQNAKKQWLIQQRPARGRWAGMWQFLTLPKSDPLPSAIQLITPLSLRGQFSHALSHRNYRFTVKAGQARASRSLPSAACRWVSFEELNSYPLPRPQLLAAKLLIPGCDK